MPKIIAVDSNIDIFPERRSFTGTGHYLLQNKTNAPITQIHISDAHAAAFGSIDLQPSISKVQFDRPFHIVSSSPTHVYTIYQFDTPLAPRGEGQHDLLLSHTSAAASRTATSAPSSPTPVPSSTAATFPTSATTGASS